MTIVEMKITGMLKEILSNLETQYLFRKADIENSKIFCEKWVDTYATLITRVAYLVENDENKEHLKVALEYEFALFVYLLKSINIKYNNHDDNIEQMIDKMDVLLQNNIDKFASIETN